MDLLYQIAKAKCGQRTSPWSMEFIYGWQAENEDENKNKAGDEHDVHNDAADAADDVNVDDDADDDKRPVTI